MAPALARRLRWGGGGDHLRGGAQGAELRIGSQWRPLRLSAADLEGLPAGDLLMIGIGEGCAVEAALARPEGAVIAWERDPLLLIAALRRFDWSAPLRAGRLRLGLGVDLLDLRAVTAQRWVHPALRSTLAQHLALLDGPADAPRVLLAEGDLFVEDLASALRAAGYAVVPWDIRRCAPEELNEAARRVEARFVLAVNHTEGLCEATRRLGLPLLIWEIDPSLSDPKPPVGKADHCWVFTYRQAHVALYAAARFPQVAYLPLAADPRRRRPVAAGPRQGLVFVGSSMVENGRKWRAAFLSVVRQRLPQLDPAQAQRKVEQLLAEQRRSPMAYTLPARVDEAFPGLRLGGGEIDPAALLGEAAAAERRLLLVGRLGPLGVQVWGDEGWRLLSGAGVVHRGFAAHGEALSRLYSEARVNVDIGRLYQLDIVTMRVFDVLACGGFLLAERCPALGELFTEGVHLEAWGSPEELVEKAQFYLRHPAQAAAMGLAGRAAVEARHDIRQRLATMLHTAKVAAE